MKIAVGGSAADPPHKGHRLVLQKLCSRGLFDLVIWIVSGNRMDKQINVCPNHRIAMTELMISRYLRRGSNPSLIVMYDDIYGVNTPTIDWLEKILPKQYPGAELYWFTGSDSVMPQQQYGGKCEIQKCWDKGERLFREYRFLVVERSTYPLDRASLPDNITVIGETPEDIKSSTIRQLIKAGKKYDHLVPQAVADYIKKHQLYR